MRRYEIDPRLWVWIDPLLPHPTHHSGRGHPWKDHHTIINGSRRKRIAHGSGTSVEDVNRLLKQFAQTQKLMKSLVGKKKGKGKWGHLPFPRPF